MRKPLLLLGLLAVLAAGAARSAPGALTARSAEGGSITLPSAEARERLARPVVMDAASARVMERVARGYAALKSLHTIARSGGLVGEARMMRPRYFHFNQRHKDGELIALAISDGDRYYEYTERTRIYLERDAAVLGSLVLPANVRLFFAGQKSGNAMDGLDGRPTARDFAYRHGGRHTAAGRPADLLHVSTMARGADGRWQVFEGRRYYDAQTGLLLRTVNGARVVEIENRVNPALPKEGFRWKPIPGGRKGFG